MDLATTERQIKELKSAIEIVPDANGLIRLSELYIYRYRIQLFHALVGANISSETIESEALDRNWLSTGIDRLHNMVYQARGLENYRQVNALITDPLVSDNILPAVYYLKMSRSRSPLKPSVHLLLAQLHAVSPTKDADVFHLRRGLQLAPANSITALICGILNLQANRLDEACENLKKCLQIERANYKRVVRVAVPFLPAERIEQDILPDDPLLLFSFAKVYMSSKSMKSLKLNVFQRVENLLNKGQQWDRKSLEIKAEVQEVLDDLTGAIKTRRMLVDLNQTDPDLGIKLARLYIKNGDLDEAMLIVRYLLRNNRTHKNV